MDASRPQSVKPVQKGRGSSCGELGAGAGGGTRQTVKWREEEKQRERKEQFVLSVLE